jgi:hypothetical protein
MMETKDHSNHHLSNLRDYPESPEGTLCNVKGKRGKKNHRNLMIKTVHYQNSLK